MCFGMGKDAPNVTLAPPLAEYPSSDDAAFARDVGAFYGTGVEPFATGQAAVMFGDANGPAPGQGQYLSTLTDPAYAVATESPDVPNAGAIPDTYARAGLAANRSAIVGLGYDPRKFSMDGYTDQGSANVGGAYSPSKDHGFVIPGESADAASTMAHESIHRGLKILRDEGAMPPVPGADRLAATDEESIVRLIMERAMGNPEMSPSAIAQKSSAKNQFFLRDGMSGSDIKDYVAAIEAAAAQSVARRRPGGPR